MMEKEYFHLLSVLDMLIAFYRELLSVEQEKLNLIIKQNWRGLEKQVEKSREILKSIESAEITRLELIEKIAGRSDLSLSNLAKSLPKQMKEDLLSSGEILQSMIVELKNLNKQSEQLLESSLEVIDFTLDLFSGASSKGKTYSGEGEEKKDEGKHTSLVFDLKA